MDVVDLTMRRQARAESWAIRAAYDVAQNRRELEVILRSRRARLARIHAQSLRRQVLFGLLGLTAGFAISQFVSAPELTDQARLHADRTAAVAVKAPIPTISAANQTTLMPIAISPASAPTIAQAPLTVVPTSSAPVQLSSTVSVPLLPIATAATVVVSPRPSSPAKSAPQSVQAPREARGTPVPSLERGSYEAQRPATVSTAPTLDNQKPTSGGRTVALPSSPTRERFSVIGVPSDGVVIIQMAGDPTVRYVKVGEVLPNGATVVRATADTGAVETDR